jgi:hypothetical protein
MQAAAAQSAPRLRRRPPPPVRYGSNGRRMECKEVHLLSTACLCEMSEMARQCQRWRGERKGFRQKAQAGGGSSCRREQHICELCRLTCAKYTYALVAADNHQHNGVCLHCDAAAPPQNYISETAGCGDSGRTAAEQIASSIGSPIAAQCSPAAPQQPAPRGDRPGRAMPSGRRLGSRCAPRRCAFDTMVPCADVCPTSHHPHPPTRAPAAAAPDEAVPLAATLKLGLLFGAWYGANIAFNM